MRLLLDMGLSPRTAEHLRGTGHDVVHLRDQGLARLPDPEIVTKARAEDRVVVTFDLDFGRLLALQRVASPSVILFRLEEATTDQINALMTNLLAQFESELGAGAIIVIDSDRVRIRKLPIW
jgi:predicted nuclease of predicted toxin-antitoxin system